MLYPIDAYVSDINGQDVRLDAFLCGVCCRYYVESSELQRARAIHGLLIGNIKSLSGGGFDYDRLSDSSVLKNCGYTVNRSEGLDDKQRHMVLKRLIDQKILTKQRVISYLRFFINNSQGRKGMRKAVSMWTADLKWVQDYNIT